MVVIMIAIYLILFITSLLFYILYEGAFSFYLFCFVLLMPLILNLLLAHCKKNITVDFVEAQQTACRKDKIPIVIKTVNLSRIPIPNCIITVAYTNCIKNETETFKINTPLFPKNTQYLTVNLTAKHYGMINLKISAVKIVDIFRIFKRKIKLVHDSGRLSACSVAVFPDLITLENNVSDYSDMGLDTNSYSKFKKGDDPSEIFDIHEYAEGDKISRIHWKLTAKQDKTMVKDYSLPITNSILIAVDLSLKEKKSEKSLLMYDTIIETVSSLSMHLTENDCPHKVMWYDKLNQKNVKCDVCDADNCRYMINQLLKAQMFDETRTAELLDDENSKYGHLIYCTTEYNENLYGLFNDCDISYRYTVLTALSAGSEKIPEFESENYRVVSVAANAVSESLQDICL